MKFDKTNYKAAAGSGITSVDTDENGKSTYPLVATDDIAYDDNTRLDEYLERVDEKIENAVSSLTADTIKDILYGKSGTYARWVADGGYNVTIFVDLGSKTDNGYSTRVISQGNFNHDDYKEGINFPSYVRDEFGLGDTDNEMYDLTDFFNIKVQVHDSDDNYTCYFAVMDVRQGSSSWGDLGFIAPIIVKNVIPNHDLKIQALWDPDYNDVDYIEIYPAELTASTYILNTGDQTISGTLTATTFYEKE